MDMSTTSYDKEIPQIGASGSGNYNNYWFNSMREHMFDKVLTPSDVGKLNRLVIPKRHAENYFPLVNNENEERTVLNFQDRNDKVWRFRYLYWNSSQSYVMTKGWIRFVKEKKLVAGDTVSFHRGYIPDDNEPEKRRKLIFIDWRHRAETNLVHNINQNNFFFGSPTYPVASYYPTEYSMPSYHRFPPFYHNQYQEREILGYDPARVVGGRYHSGSPLDHHNPQRNLGRPEQLVYDLVPVFQAAAKITPSEPPRRSEGTSTAKKLRLFGVDVEESSSSGETPCGTGVAGYSSSSPVIRDEDQSSWRLPHGEMGVSSSSGMQLSDDEEYKRKGKSLAL